MLHSDCSSQLIYHIGQQGFLFDLFFLGFQDARLHFFKNLTLFEGSFSCESLSLHMLHKGWFFPGPTPQWWCNNKADDYANVNRFSLFRSPPAGILRWSALLPRYYATAMPSSSSLNLMKLKNQTQRQKLRERSDEKRLMLSKRTHIERTWGKSHCGWRGLGKGKSSENTLVIRKQGKREKREIKKCSCV